MFLKSPKVWNSFSKMMMAVAFLFVLLGAYFAFTTYLFLKRAVSADAKIVELIEKKGDDGQNLYKPVFLFQDINGNTHKIVSSTASYPPIGKIGDTIQVFYEPQSPNHAEEGSFFNLWGAAAVSGGMGAGYFIFFWVVAVITKRKMKAANPPLEPIR